MKLAVSVSLIALALAGCATSAPPNAIASTVPDAPGEQANATEPAGLPTAEEARAFVAAAEKDLLAHALIYARADWVNNTYVTEDTDAVAAYFNAIGTEKSVRYAKEAARLARRPASISTPPESSIS